MLAWIKIRCFVDAITPNTVAFHGSLLSTVAPLVRTIGYLLTAYQLLPLYCIARFEVLPSSKVKVPVIWEMKPYVGSALKMEAAGPSEALVPIYLTTTSHRTLED